MSKPEKTKLIHIKISPQMHQKLKEMAIKEYRSITNMAERLISEGLKKNENK